MDHTHITFSCLMSRSNVFDETLNEMVLLPHLILLAM